MSEYVPFERNLVGTNNRLFHTRIDIRGTGSFFKKTGYDIYIHCQLRNIGMVIAERAHYS